MGVNHTVNFGSEMVLAKHVSRKNIFFSMNMEKIREEGIFEIVHCPFEGRAKLHHLCQPNGLIGRIGCRWQLERAMYNFKISFPPAFFYIHRAKCIFSRDMFFLPLLWAKIRGVELNHLQSLVGLAFTFLKPHSCDSDRLRIKLKILEALLPLPTL